MSIIFRPGAVAPAEEGHAPIDRAESAGGPSGVRTAVASGMQGRRRMTSAEKTSARGGALRGRRILVTGIADGASLALHVARCLVSEGAEPVCTGLGPTPHAADLSARARRHLEANFESFRETAVSELGARTHVAACDLGRDESIADLASWLADRGLELDGVLHAVAFDRTLRHGGSAPLLETTREDFMECMNVSAYSLIALLRGLLGARRLRAGASVVALSYIGAERVVSHPYRNVGVAKAALERMTLELAAELGPAHGLRVNAVRFSPYGASRAGGAIPGLAEAEARAAARSPLGNAPPDALGAEVAHLMRPGLAITGEIRHVDGGLHALA
jgi:enoyl-[acyl-carrier protein] reductase I